MKQLLTLALLLTGLQAAMAQNVGIGTIFPTDQLHTTGSVRFQNYSGIGTRLLYIDSAGKLAPPPTGTLYTNPTPGAIPNNGCGSNTGLASSISVSGQPASVASSQISVLVNITHPADAELSLLLLAPNGALLLLSANNGGAGGNYTTTIFADDAPAAITGGAVPFTGRYRPQGSTGSVCVLTPTVSTFGAIGSGSINPNGVWTLKVFDNGAGNIGTLNSWQITFGGQGAFGTTGLTGTVPYFKNGLLTASNLYYDGSSKAGIGTTAPQQSFSVNGAVNIGQADTSTGQRADLTFGSSSGEGIGSARAGSNNVVGLDFYTSFAKRMSITNTGRVGIGLSNPQAQFHVDDAQNSGFPVLISSSNAANTILQISNSTSTASQIGVGFYRNGTAKAATFLDGNDNLQLYTAGAGGSVYVSQSGNVGVGINNPQQNLSVKAGLNIDQAEANGNNLTNVLRFGNNSSEAIGSNRTNITTGANYYGLDFYTAGINRLAIGNGGNIGIGNTTPGFPLNFSNALGSKVSFYGNSGNHYGIGVQANLLQFYTDVNTADLAFGYGSSASFTENMRIRGDGNVGIGVNNPQQNLSVKNGMNIDQAGTNGNASTNVLRFGNSSGESIGSNRAVTTVGTNNNGLDFYTASANRMAITNGGNVGIGTLSPAEKLEIAGNEKLSGNMTVQNNKGIIRNNSATQLKQVITASTFVGSSIAPSNYIVGSLTFAEPFSAPPAVYMGNIVTIISGNPAYFTISITNVTTTGCNITFLNLYNATLSFNATWNFIAVGPQ